MVNIWSTPEAEAWSRGLCHLDYEKLCVIAGTRPLCVQAYLALCKAFDEEMEHDPSQGW